MHPGRNKTQQTTLKHGKAWTFLIWHTQTLCAVGTQWPLSGPSWTEQSHFEGQDPIVREAQTPETAGLKTLADLSVISLCWDSDFLLGSNATHISSYSKIYISFPFYNMIICLTEFSRFNDLRYDIRLRTLTNHLHVFSAFCSSTLGSTTAQGF